MVEFYLEISMRWIYLLKCPSVILLIALTACQGSTVNTLQPIQPPLTTTALDLNRLAALVPGAVQLRVSGSERPDSIQWYGRTYVPVSDLSGSSLYVALFAEATQPFDLSAPADLPAETEIVELLSATDAQLIYQNDPTVVDFEDFVLVFATSQLPVALRQAQNIVDLAHQFFPGGNFTVANLNPVPDSTNSNFAEPSSGIAPDLVDVLAVYAASQLPAPLRTEANIITLATAVAPTMSITSLNSVPGVSPSPIPTPGSTVVNTDQDTTTPGDSLCSLREAIESSDPDSCGPEQALITFEASLAGQTLTINSTLLVDRDVEIEGLSPGGITISGGDSVGVFEINAGRTVTLDQLTITSGRATFGGGIVNQGTLTVSTSTFSDNSADNGGGGGIYNQGTLTVSNSTFSGNFAYGGGGGIYNDATLTVSSSTFSENSAAVGGAIFNYDTQTVSNSTLSSNSAYFSGGGIFNQGTQTVSSSTFSNNVATSFTGGGILNNGTQTISNSSLTGNSASLGGGGIYNYSVGTQTISNSTLSGNSANEGGGGILNTGTQTVSSSSLAGNSANVGGGLYNYGTQTVTNCKLDS